METPVAFIVFNRPGVTQQVFDRIRAARPARLYVSADGPRSEISGEADLCEAARHVTEQVDWDCDVHRDYSDINLGCGRRMASAIDAVFRAEEEAIILEDDCLPDPTFFPYCEQLLDRYRSDERIMAISGTNLQMGQRRSPYSYYFSLYNHCWGWASWRRAWRHFDFRMATWPEFRDGKWLGDVFRDAWQVRYWRGFFEDMYTGKIDAWAARWTFACWSQSGLTVLPNRNLISNIGFGEGATHTTSEDVVSALPTHPIPLPLDHPPFVVRDVRADEFTNSFHYASTRRVWLGRQAMRVPRKIRRIFTDFRQH